MVVEEMHSGRVVNHIYPDADRSVGIDLTYIKETEYPTNVLKATYKEPEMKVITSKQAVSQEKTRQRWEKAIEKIKAGLARD